MTWKTMYPKTIASELVSVKPMSKPTGKIFYSEPIFSLPMKTTARKPTPDNGYPIWNKGYREETTTNPCGEILLGGGGD